MADFIPANGQMKRLETPLTRTQLVALVGEAVQFHKIPSGDFIVSGKSTVLNSFATTLAHFPLFGDVVLCSLGDIA
jgi:hypothetical protein